MKKIMFTVAMIVMSFLASVSSASACSFLAHQPKCPDSLIN